MIRLFLGVLFCLFGLALSAQEKDHLFTDRELEKYKSILDMDSRAQMEANLEQSVNDSYLAHLKDFLDISLGGLSQLLDESEMYNEDLLGELKDCPESWWCEYLQADIMTHMALVHVLENRRYAAIFELNKANKLVNKVMRERPGFLPAQKTSALISLLMTQIPESQMRWVRIFTSLSADEQGSIDRLKEIAQSSSYVSTEASWVLSLYYLRDDPQLSLQWIECTQGSHSCRLLRSMALLKLGEHQRMETLLGVNAENTDLLPADYLLAKSYLHQGSVEKALSLFDKFLSDSQAIHLHGSAQLSKRWCELLLSDESSTEVEDLEYVLYEDIQARREFISAPEPQLDILKGRLAIDGGNYDKAVGIFLSMNTEKLSLADQEERLYRLARAYQKSGDVDNAIDTYEELISAYSDSERYYLTASYLQMARLSLDDSEKAMAFAKKCLDTQPARYKKSLHREAKTILKLL